MALGAYVRPVAYCEIDRYAQSVLLSRMSEGRLPIAPIWDDVSTLHGSDLPPIDIIYGGFPCQDLSTAGRGRGLAGERSGLFFQILRLAKEIKPRFIFLENVPAIRTRGLDRVGRELAEAGYDCRWLVVSAAAVGANHKRERWFLLGYAKHHGQHGTEKSGSLDSTVSDYQKRTDETLEFAGASSPRMLARKFEIQPSGNVAHTNSQSVQTKATGRKEYQRQRHKIQSITASSCPEVANTQSQRCNPGGQPMRTAEEIARPEQHGQYDSNPNGTGCEELNTASQPVKQGFNSGCSSAEWGATWWAAEPSVGRVAHGIPQRVDRIKCLGNGVVPLQVKTAFELLSGLRAI